MRNLFAEVIHRDLPDSQVLEKSPAVITDQDFRPPALNETSEIIPDENSTEPVIDNPTEPIIDNPSVPTEISNRNTTTVPSRPFEIREIPDLDLEIARLEKLQQIARLRRELTQMEAKNDTNPLCSNRRRIDFS